MGIADSAGGAGGTGDLLGVGPLAVLYWLVEEIKAGPGMSTLRQGNSN